MASFELIMPPVLEGMVVAAGTAVEAAAIVEDADDVDEDVDELDPDELTLEELKG